MPGVNSEFCADPTTRRSFVSTIFAALVLCFALPGAAKSPETRRMTAGLQHALEGKLPAEGLGIAVTLRQADLPQRGARRRSAVNDRQQRVLGALPGSGLRLKHRFRTLAGFAGAADRRTIELLSRHPDVESIYVDGRVYASLAQGVNLIGANTAHALGVTGAGVKVAVLDTGIDTNHPDLSDDLVAEHCFCDTHPSPVTGACCPGGVSEGPSAEDDEGHGTAVAGIITSSGAAASLGVAPDAEIVAVKVLSNTGSGSFSDIAAALDWVLVERADPTSPVFGTGVVNMSIGDGAEYANPAASPCTGSNTANAISALHSAGVAVFVASGNEGYDNGISFPACVPDAISVGGVYDANIGSVSWCGNVSCSEILCTDNPTSADEFVCHSNSDEILDLLAPDYRTATSKMGGGTLSFGGTSAASPYAAAEAALMLQVNPALTPEEIRSHMKANGPSVTNSDNGLSFTRTQVSAILPLIDSVLCGDGDVDPGEDCDDGGTLNGDCCSATCAFEIGACDDGDACSDGDTCDGAGACISGVGLACDDGQFCNGSEDCDAVTGCVPGTPPGIDDAVGCTDDSCDEENDVIVHAANDALCDDAQFCNGAETCDALNDCQAGIPPSVDDGISCTDDSCDEGNDVVVHAANDALCDDGQVCNGTETCDVLIDCQAGAPLEIDDGVACTVDSCDEMNDLVLYVENDALCDDADPCTADACDVHSGCSHVPIVNCGAAIAATPGRGLAILASILLASGAALLAGREHIIGARGKR